MSKYTIADVETKLSKGIWKVTFEKVTDATVCTMICTRDFNWLRSEGISDEMDYADPNGGYCPNPAIKVWCIERAHDGEVYEDVRAWRSCYPETIESMEFYSPTDDSEIEIDEQD